MEGLVDPPMRGHSDSDWRIDRASVEIHARDDTALNLSTVERFIPEMHQGLENPRRACR